MPPKTPMYVNRRFRDAGFLITGGNILNKLVYLNLNHLLIVLIILVPLPDMSVLQEMDFREWTGEL